MWEMPDKRVWFFMGPIVALAIAFAVVPPDHPAERYVEPLLYIACAVLGMGVGVLSIRERYSLFRPSHTLEDSPILFWLDVAVGCFVFGGVAIWKISQVLSHAL